MFTFFFLSKKRGVGVGDLSSDVTCKLLQPIDFFLFRFSKMWELYKVTYLEINFFFNLWTTRGYWKVLFDILPMKKNKTSINLWERFYQTKDQEKLYSETKSYTKIVSIVCWNITFIFVSISRNSDTPIG